MRPFFRHFGGKWLLSRKLSPPKYDHIIEPFAGGAGYSVRYGAGLRVDLYDVDPVTCEIWRWLLNATPAQVLDLPVQPLWDRADVRELGLEPGAEYLIRRWLTMMGSPSNTRLAPVFCRYGKEGKALGSFWSERVKQRIADQLPMIRRWSIHQLPYTEIDTSTVAHWEVDPPYQHNVSGRSTYGKASGVDYTELADWCRTLKGEVIVHEQHGADWLPFETLTTTAPGGRAKAGKRSKAHEIIWTN